MKASLGPALRNIFASTLRSRNVAKRLPPTMNHTEFANPNMLSPLLALRRDRLELVPRTHVRDSFFVAGNDDLGALGHGMTVVAARARHLARAVLGEDDLARSAFADRARHERQHADDGSRGQRPLAAGERAQEAVDGAPADDARGQRRARDRQGVPVRGLA